MAGTYNHIVLVGRLVADPELRQTQQGIPVTSFRIAVDRQRGRDGGEKQTDFFGVSIWRQRAERAAEFLQKGRLVLISGRCQIREYTDKENNRRTAVEVVADDFQMLDSRPGMGGGGAAQERAAAAPSSELPEYKYDAESEEEVPF
ncbi:MAG: single-stranded DNA-binding protein [Candidatus Eremiobacteraeota bacterium]|nr:single-stranded DNA-binding protein [Candidatus Eremiobacteraeota bacterium]MBV8364933.1 single-stranded DNA-binding protein [Candidatus Eremiobacteraeota bacterium]